MLLVFLPYVWSTPIKLIQEFGSRMFKSKLTLVEKRHRLAKMVLETSLVLLYDRKSSDGILFFIARNVILPSKSDSLKHIKKCTFSVRATSGNTKIPIFDDLVVNGEEITDINECFAFLNLLCSLYTHTLIHCEAANIADVNLTKIKYLDDIAMMKLG